MTDYEKNYKTLIVCFVIALAVLIPLRFVEVKNGNVIRSRAQVLGDIVVFEKEKIVEEESLAGEVGLKFGEEIILPDTNIDYLIENGH